MRVLNVSRVYNITLDFSSWLIEMAQIQIMDQNLRNLEAIQKIMSMEEGHESNLDEALSRILEFYRKLVPYN